MAYTIDIYPNPENAQDKPYFTKAIFSNSCQRGKENMSKIQDLLGDIITDQRTKEAVIGVLKGQSMLLDNMIYGVKTNQITFTNPDKQTEETE
ncbi:TPA: hypothetical protein TT574_001101 [Streptococcus equi subsp. zooepidemicus]|nr:hypothetical protein JavanS193_0013 [Streptococcus satellite phage Javan193]QBX07836.1 hypothetical protein JavanS194_0013 [Streptococcus satellite phage Javan194]QBX07855.1 hypothetical protein JavanS195_0011 [Streptococcus satellite phage Javan195]HEK9955264.1 hypothetical protein [Streptococcus equi subsp. zooepidemicus]HEK9993961.1 hypothetical protein [Streptococcus equi subsp. zooepidemicus]